VLLLVFSLLGASCGSTPGSADGQLRTSGAPSLAAHPPSAGDGGGAGSPHAGNANADGGNAREQGGDAEPAGGHGTGHGQSGTRRRVGSRGRVTRVVDGDTVYVRLRTGRTLDVRLIGIDTPETVAPGQPIGCYGPEASRFTHARLDGGLVRLRFDVERHDRYGRTLAYVFSHGRLFNRVLVARGFARVDTFPPNVRYESRFEVAERRARSRRVGLWAACGRGRSRSGHPGAGGRRCDRSYPTVCIPSPPPDLDCADIGFRRFKVRPPDDQNFDGDHDGVGCET
jgi:endonuclease YncB( thermonuclease family)